MEEKGPVRCRGVGEQVLNTRRWSMSDKSFPWSENQAPRSTESDRDSSRLVENTSYGVSTSLYDEDAVCVQSETECVYPEK